MKSVFAMIRRQILSEIHLPRGTRAHREYGVTFRHHSGSVAFTLGDLRANTAGARLAQFADARLYGLIAILGLPGAPRFPIVWILTADQIELALAEQDHELSNDLKQVIADQLDVFFSDIVSLAPEIAQIGHPTRGAEQRTLN